MITDLNSNEQFIGWAQHSAASILDNIFAEIGVTNRMFVEFGVGRDGSQCNTGKLRHDGWTGLWMDLGGDGVNVKAENITAENINALLDKYAVPREFDVLGIDIDGMDWWVWRAINRRPRVVVIEYNASWGPHRRVTVPYDPNFRWRNDNHFGGSFAAMRQLGKWKGYTMVGTCKTGVDAFLVRDDLIPGHFAVPEEKLFHPPGYGAPRPDGTPGGHPEAHKLLWDISENDRPGMVAKAPVGVTHTGKLGDFYFSLPIASWIYRDTGRKIHWVLAKNFKLFEKLPSLLMLQEMTAAVTLVDVPGFYWALGGQPWKFDPRKLGVPVDKYYNIGYPGWPNIFASQYCANYATGGNWDQDFVLNLGPITPTNETVCTEHAHIKNMNHANPDFPNWVFPDMSGDILPVFQRFAAAKSRHCGFSSVAVAMLFANLPFKLYGLGFPKADWVSFFSFRKELFEVILPEGAPHNERG